MKDAVNEIDVENVVKEEDENVDVIECEVKLGNEKYEGLED